MNSHDVLKIGVWAYGTLTIIGSAACLLIVTIAATYLDGEATFKVGTPKWVQGSYLALKGTSSLIGGLLGFSALAWAHIFDAYIKCPM